MKTRQKRLAAWFCALFALLCALPVLLMPILRDDESAVSEKKSARPVFVRPDGSLNADALTGTADYLSDHFALRDALVTARARTIAAVFGESASDQVILGRDGWLFYAETLDDYERTAPMSGREIWCAARTLYLMQEYAASQGASFLFVSAPDKNAVCPGQMPAKYRQGTAPGNYERLYAELARQGVKRRRTRCRRCRKRGFEQVYYAWDSHWNGLGSAIAHDEILRALGREGIALGGDLRAEKGHRGDLYAMLYPAGNWRWNMGAELARARRFAYVGAVRGAGRSDDPDELRDRRRAAFSCSATPSAARCMRDMAESFRTACFSRPMPVRSDADWTKRGPTRWSWSWSSGTSGWLCEKGAQVMPGPARDGRIRGPPRAAGRPQSLRVAGRTRLEGCVCYRGNRRTAPGWTPIRPFFLELDGSSLSRPLPAGEGENPFTLRAPAAARVRVLVRCGGTWTAATAG
jgi:hypothetical protein